MRWWCPGEKRAESAFSRSSKATSRLGSDKGVIPDTQGRFMEDTQATRLRLARRLPAALALLQPQHEADDFGDGFEVLGRYRVVDIHRGVERAGQRRILDDRDVVFL